MKIARSTLLAAALALPATAHAAPLQDFYFWDALCSSGAVVACGSVLVRTVQIDAQNNIVQVLIRNLQGFDVRDNTSGSIFNAFSLFLPNSPVNDQLDASVPLVGTEGAVGVKGQPIYTGGAYYDGIQEDNGFLLYQLDALDGPPGDGIRGCERGPSRPAYNNTPVSTVNTCAAQDYSGWATISTRRDIFFDYQWDISGASFTAYGVARDGTGFQINFPAQGNLLAATAATAATTVTPEPSTWVLLGSGLALLAVVGRVRSKRDRAR